MDGSFFFCFLPQPTIPKYEDEFPTPSPRYSPGSPPSLPWKMLPCVPSTYSPRKCGLAPHPTPYNPMTGPGWNVSSFFEIIPSPSQSWAFGV